MLTTSLTSTVAIRAAEETHKLPAPAWVWGVSALAVFMLLLGITWAFKNVGQKH